MHKFAYALIGLAVIAGTSSLFAQDNAEEARIKRLQEAYAQLNAENRAAQGRFRPVGGFNPVTDNAVDARKKALIEGDVRRKLLQWYDKDGDGKLNATEKAAAQAGFLNVLSSVSEPETRRSPGGRSPIDSATLERLRAEREAQQRQLEAAFDRNKDGQLSNEEREAMLEDYQKKRDAARARLMKELDKDGDGELSGPERDGARAIFEKRREEYTRKYDQDGNGTVDSNEREAMYDDRRKQLEEVTKKYDTNGNGYLEFEEEQKAYADGVFEVLGFSSPNVAPVGFGRPRTSRPERGGRPIPPRREGIRAQRPGS